MSDSHATSLDRKQALAILRHNQGFAEPERWISVAQKHRFRPVRAQLLLACPGCGDRYARPIAQYVYYSTLMRLRECSCGLIYSDARLEPSVVFGHFQETYKDESYLAQRGPIFAHLVDTISRISPAGSVVLDVGGGKGHLMARLRQRRPDVDVVVNDLSTDACRWATGEYGLTTQCGDLADIAGSFDTVVISDALYYMPDIAAAWRAIDRLVNPRGTLILRIPNRHWLIRAALIPSRNTRQTRVPGFNPEHMYLFTRSYLRGRLRQLGFSGVQWLSSPLIGTTWQAALMYRLLQRGPLTPSVLVVARRS